jgi:hypothetical protein
MSDNLFRGNNRGFFRPDSKEGNLRGRGASLGGIRPKCTVIDEDGSLGIGKFPSIGDERAVTYQPVVQVAEFQTVRHRVLISR